MLNAASTCSRSPALMGTSVTMIDKT